MVAISRGVLLVIVATVLLSVAAAAQTEFRAAGHGVITATGAPGCQFTAAGCAVSSRGTLQGTLIGDATFVSSLTVAWSAATPNGAGGYCAPASGTVDVTSEHGALRLQEQGTVCEVGATASQAPHTLNATFYILGGTGRFADLQGTGTAVSSDDGRGKILAHLDGTVAALGSEDAPSPGAQTP